MSYLAEELNELFGKKKIKPAELSRATGIDKATISRWLHGQQLVISTPDLEKLCQAVSDDPKEQARIIRARMLDVCEGPGSELLDVVFRGEPPVQLAVKRKTRPLPREQQHVFDVLAANLKDRELWNLLKGLVEMYEAKEAREKKEIPK